MFITTEATSRVLRDGAAELRWEVFVREQNVPMILEIDAYDLRSDVIHLVGYEVCEDTPCAVIATLRIVPLSNNRYRLGRFAVKYAWRKKGKGSQLLRAAHEHISRLTPIGQEAHILLDAQVQAEKFYEKHGYRPTTHEVFEEAGIAHKEMIAVVASLQER
ncbi:GNAT family N-acetyltransferase [Schaalia sp. lx-260]|uniref:GNAT family N-acetyltransferase n=1 Tax=Schaalia sp. lx-260 TaxID=2899082 RepID=UPI001E59E193|nr:GNAT family N-acetyltransferase [Schaalia sp. lx-260]MCD4549253.1 GNAT family N-acetyltransferase [Schaalia sp. lx-260]